MKKLIGTLYRNFRYYFIHFLLLPVLASLIVYALMLVIKYKKSKDKMSLGNYIKLNIFERKNLFTILPVLYSFILCHSTVTNRIITGQKFEPLSNVFGGWTIIEHQYSYDLSPIWNVVMFLPMAVIIELFIKNLKSIKFSVVKNIVLSCLLSFSMSLTIEILQTLCHCGTFQFSDLFYNTLGGLIGALIYLGAVKIINNKRC